MEVAANTSSPGQIELSVGISPPGGWNPSALAGQAATLAFAPTIVVTGSNVTGQPSLAALQGQQIPVTMGSLIQYTNNNSASTSGDASTPPFGLSFCNCGTMTTGAVSGDNYSYIISVNVADPAAFLPATSASGYNMWGFAPSSCTLTVPGLPAIA